MSNKKINIPELRFPEFKNEGEWEVNKIDNIFDLQDGYPFSSFDFTNAKKDSNQVIRITDINNQNKNDEKVYVSISKIHELNIEKYKVRKGDLLLSLTGAAGFNFFIWNGSDAFINQRTIKIKTKINGVFLSYYLNNAKKRDIAQIAQGISVVHLYANQLKTLVLNLPKPKEQQKIALCLSALDELITAQSEKIEQLQQHKKGLMQGLFPKIND
jgi:type I restriction enzyme S subunit